MSEDRVDIYRLPIFGAIWSRCGGNTGDKGGDNESCVLIAQIPGTDGWYIIQDSKNPQAGELRFNRSELRSLFARLRADL